MPQCKFYSKRKIDTTVQVLLQKKNQCHNKSSTPKEKSIPQYKFYSKRKMNATIQVLLQKKNECHNTSSIPKEKSMQQCKFYSKISLRPIFLYLHFTYDFCSAICSSIWDSLTLSLCTDKCMYHARRVIMSGHLYVC